MKKASIMREKCCGMVLHGGRPDPVEVVDALTELEAERDAAHAAGRKEALEEASAACEERADQLSDMGCEMECCVGTALNCGSDIDALHHQKEEG